MKKSKNKSVRTSPSPEFGGNSGFPTTRSQRKNADHTRSKSARNDAVNKHFCGPESDRLMPFDLLERQLLQAEEHEDMEELREAEFKKAKFVEGYLKKIRRAERLIKQKQPVVPKKRKIQVKNEEVETSSQVPTHKPSTKSKSRQKKKQVDNVEPESQNKSDAKSTSSQAKPGSRKKDSKLSKTPGK